MDTKGGKVGKREGKMSAKGTREEKICAIAKKYFFMKVLFILHSDTIHPRQSWPEGIICARNSLFALFCRSRSEKKSRLFV